MEQLLELFNDFMWEVVSGILQLAMPILVGFVIYALNVQIAKWRMNLTEKQNAVIDKIVAGAVKTAQQLKASGALGSGEEALEYAKNIVQQKLTNAGIKIEVEEILDSIEAKYHDYIAPTSSNAHWFLEEVVSMVVTAYIETGLSLGLKDEIVKKADAHLKQYGIVVNIDTIEALVIAKIIQVTAKAVE